MKKYLIISFLAWSAPSAVQAQNLNKYPINVAQRAPAFIKFKERIKTAEFSTPTAYDNYQIRVRNDDNTLIIQYSGAGNTPIDEGLSIVEGKRNHFLIVSYLKDYDINKNAQLYYALDDLKNLKTIATEQNQMANASQAERDALAEKKRKAEEEKQEQEMIAAKNEIKQKERSRKKEIEAEKIANTKKEQEEKALLAQKEKEQLALQKEQQKLAKEHQEAVRKEKAIEAEKEKLAKAKMDESQRVYKAAQQQIALEKAQAERQAKEKREEEAKAKLLAAQEEKASLAAQKKSREEERKYGTVGLWERYGKKGISVYEIPEKQMEWVNADFYLSKDTLFNYNMAQQIMAQDDRDIEATQGSQIKNNVTIALKDIQFKGPYTYYKIKIDNPGDEDFLTGAVVAEVYDQNKAHKQELNISYFTYIGMYPLLRPHSSHYVVLATRTPTIDNGDDVVLFLYERREARGYAHILIKGATLNREMGKIEQPINKSEKPKKKKEKK